MVESQLRARRYMWPIVCFGVSAALGLMFLAAAAQSAAPTGVSARVVSTNKGPVPACADDGSDCTDENRFWHFVHVVNSKSLTNANGGTSRSTVPNSFVVESVDADIFLDGAPFPGLPTVHFAPPPNIEPASLRAASGRWPMTVLCTSGPPCTEVTSPAIVPGENAVAFYAGWVHFDSEPDGTGFIKYTVHGTLNGVPTDVVAVSPKITLTR